jgi:hypothetical protein
MLKISFLLRVKLIFKIFFLFSSEIDLYILLALEAFWLFRIMFKVSNVNLDNTLKNFILTLFIIQLNFIIID